MAPCGTSSSLGTALYEKEIEHAKGQGCRRCPLTARQVAPAKVPLRRVFPARTFRGVYDDRLASRHVALSATPRNP